MGLKDNKKPDGEEGQIPINITLDSKGILNRINKENKDLSFPFKDEIDNYDIQVGKMVFGFWKNPEKKTTYSTNNKEKDSGFFRVFQTLNGIPLTGNYRDYIGLLNDLTFYGICRFPISASNIPDLLKDKSNEELKKKLSLDGESDRRGKKNVKTFLPYNLRFGDILCFDIFEYNISDLGNDQKMQKENFEKLIRNSYKYIGDISGGGRIEPYIRPYKTNSISIKHLNRMNFDKSFDYKDLKDKVNVENLKDPKIHSLQTAANLWQLAVRASAMQVIYYMVSKGDVVFSGVGNNDNLQGLIDLSKRYGLMNEAGTPQDIIGLNGFLNEYETNEKKLVTNKLSSDNNNDINKSLLEMEKNIFNAMGYFEAAFKDVINIENRNVIGKSLGNYQANMEKETEIEMELK